jgi:hypothetical protein
MKRWGLILGAAALFVTGASQAEASYRVIRWSSGFCQVWNSSIQGRPFPGDYTVVSRRHRSFRGALNRKMRLVARHRCW